MNGIGMIGAALLSVAVSVLPLAVSRTDWILIAIALPFAIVGVLALADDLLLGERITKWLLGIK